MLIHGLGGTRHTWRHLIDDLARTHTVIAPDLPGHGDSDPPAGDYSLGAHACALRDLMLSLGYPRFSLAGHSLGGGVALQTAYQFPERLDRLVLISSGGLGPEVSAPLRAATLPGADAVVAALSRLPAAVTSRALAVAPALVSGSDARQIADVLSGLRGAKQRTAFVRTARSVIDWRGQAVSAQRQTGLLHGVPVLLAWVLPTRPSHPPTNAPSRRAFLGKLRQLPDYTNELPDAFAVGDALAPLVKASGGGR